MADRPIEVRLLGPDGAPDPWDAEWYTEEEAIVRLAEDSRPELPDDAAEELAEAVHDAPWDHPDVAWVSDDGTRLRVSRTVVR